MSRKLHGSSSQNLMSVSIYSSYLCLGFETRFFRYCLTKLHYEDITSTARTVRWILRLYPFILTYEYAYAYLSTAIFATTMYLGIHEVNNNETLYACAKMQLLTIWRYIKFVLHQEFRLKEALSV